MGFLPPLVWIVFGVLALVEARLLGTWWHRKYPCALGRYIQAVAAVIIDGTAAFIIVRGVALALKG